MAWSDVLAALSAGAVSYGTQRIAQDEREEETRQFDETQKTVRDKTEMQNEISRMRLEIQQMLGELQEAGRNQRHETPSGNVVAQQAGANYRHETASGNAILGAETTRRGQDITSETTRRGQDLTFDTSNRRIDSTRQNVLDSLRNSTDRARLSAAVTERGQDTTADSSRFGAESANFRAALPKAPLFSFTTGADGQITTSQGASGGGGAAAAQAPTRPEPRPSAVAPSALSKAPAVNSVITLKDGTKVRVVKVNPDGSLETEPIRR
jgi:hypothetical protein